MIRVACAIIVEAGRVLCVQRGPSMSSSGFWEFPGGKVEECESDAECIVREIQEELNIIVQVLSEGPAVSASIGGKATIELVPFVCKWQSGDLKLLEHSEARWCDPNEMRLLEWSEADWGVLAWWQIVGDQYSA